MSFSVAIATHNRASDLEHTLAQLRRLDPWPTEILVCADGCSDRTVELVREGFPECRLIENETTLGSVASRDRLMREAEGELVLLIDDDSYPMEENFVALARSVMRDAPEVAVLSFPQRTDEFPETLDQSNFGPSQQVASFANSGALLRRSVYEQLPGFAKIFFHRYAEPDYVLQCMEAGYEVCLYTGLTIRHHTVPAMRDELLTHHFHARNECWSVLLRAPWWLVPPMIFCRACRQMTVARRRGRLWIRREPLWWREFVRGIGPLLRLRQPVSFATYRAWLGLLRQPKERLTLGPTYARDS
ncbi:MAG: glycosyltransferase family 2 protein [Opitutales bacterium]|nr:glycosyltransferase family 2 protein [Opitutales bacterium]